MRCKDMYKALVQLEHGHVGRMGACLDTLLEHRYAERVSPEAIDGWRKDVAKYAELESQAEKMYTGIQALRREGSLLDNIVLGWLHRVFCSRYTLRSEIQDIRRNEGERLKLEGALTGLHDAQEAVARKYDDRDPRPIYQNHRLVDGHYVGITGRGIEQIKHMHRKGWHDANTEFKIQQHGADQ